MRTLLRNNQSFYYCLFKSKADVIDEEGNKTGEGLDSYETAVKTHGNISPASGYAQSKTFGTMTAYQRTIVIEGVKCPIDENSVLFVDKEPEYDDNNVPIYNYTVKEKAPSLNSTSYLIEKVSVQ